MGVCSVRILNILLCVLSILLTAVLCMMLAIESADQALTKTKDVAASGRTSVATTTDTNLIMMTRDMLNNAGARASAEIMGFFAYPANVSQQYLDILRSHDANETVDWEFLWELRTQLWVTMRHSLGKLTAIGIITHDNKGIMIVENSGTQSYPVFQNATDYENHQFEVFWNDGRDPTSQSDPGTPAPPAPAAPARHAAPLGDTDPPRLRVSSPRMLPKRPGSAEHPLWIAPRRPSRGHLTARRGAPQAAAPPASCVDTDGAEHGLQELVQLGCTDLYSALSAGVFGADAVACSTDLSSVPMLAERFPGIRAGAAMCDVCCRTCARGGEMCRRRAPAPPACADGDGVAQGMAGLIAQFGGCAGARGMLETGVLFPPQTCADDLSRIDALRQPGLAPELRPRTALSDACCATCATDTESFWAARRADALNATGNATTPPKTPAPTYASMWDRPGWNQAPSWYTTEAFNPAGTGTNYGECEPFDGGPMTSAMVLGPTQDTRKTWPQMVSPSYRGSTYYEPGKSGFNAQGGWFNAEFGVNCSTDRGEGGNFDQPTSAGGTGGDFDNCPDWLLPGDHPQRSYCPGDTFLGTDAWKKYTYPLFRDTHQTKCPLEDDPQRRWCCDWKVGWSRGPGTEGCDGCTVSSFHDMDFWVLGNLAVAPNKMGWSPLVEISPYLGEVIAGSWTGRTRSAPGAWQGKHQEPVDPMVSRLGVVWVGCDVRVVSSFLRGVGRTLASPKSRIFTMAAGDWLYADLGWTGMVGPDTTGKLTAQSTGAGWIHPGEKESARTIWATEANDAYVRAAARHYEGRYAEAAEAMRTGGGGEQIDLTVISTPPAPPGFDISGLLLTDDFSIGTTASPPLEHITIPADVAASLTITDPRWRDCAAARPCGNVCNCTDVRAGPTTASGDVATTLGLTLDHGGVVEEVSAGGPAAAAGVELFWILHGVSVGTGEAAVDTFGGMGVLNAAVAAAGAEPVSGIFRVSLDYEGTEHVQPEITGGDFLPACDGKRPPPTMRDGEREKDGCVRKGMRIYSVGGQYVTSAAQARSLIAAGGDVEVDVVPEPTTEPYFMKVERMQDPYGLDWWLFIMIDRVAVLGEIERKNRETNDEIQANDKAVNDEVADDRMLLFIIVAAVMVVLVVICVVFVTAIIRPLERLSWEMAEVAVMHLDAVDENQPLSKLDEVKSMQVSFMQMIKNLREYRQYMPASVLLDDADEDEEEGEAEPSKRSDMSKSGELDESGAKGGRLSQSGRGGASGAQHSKGSRMSKMSKSQVARSMAHAKEKASAATGVGLHKKKVSLLAANVRAWSNATSHLAPAALVTLHQTYLEAFVPIVIKHKGLPDYFAGDRFFATFNAVKNCGTHKVMSSKTALLISKHVLEVKDDALKAPLQPSIGVACGEVQCGNVGVEGMKKFCCFGLPQALAIVAERLNYRMKTHILIDKSCSDEAKGTLLLRRLLSVSAFQGQKKDVILFQVLSEKKVSEDEWMYQLEEGEKNDPNAAFNAAMEAAHKGDVAAGLELLKQVSEPALADAVAGVKDLLEAEQRVADAGVQLSPLWEVVGLREKG